jgi:hypothetical protein
LLILTLSSIHFYLQAQLVLSSIAKTLHTEDMLSIVPSTVTVLSTTPTQRGDHRHSNATTAYGTPVSARNTWTDVCETWSDSNKDGPTDRSRLQFPEVGSFGSRSVSPVAIHSPTAAAAVNSFLSPMFEPAILEDSSLTPVFVDRF